MKQRDKEWQSYCKVCKAKNKEGVLFDFLGALIIFSPTFGLIIHVYGLFLFQSDNYSE